MKQVAIIYGECKTPLQKKAVALREYVDFA